ncbi:IPT/TIG domain-containing protein [Chitinophaga qingshengii]|uniref:IPT/TIG domain-containing protein n=1 Tax=Chitinophaga qingshengii TaxID=1569794 RepID=A0ABR7TM46_9BACT|nr:IPT/TIG domain-containing protein [Chitinophaga qingshengii]MBC9931562.1 IPT/TIG domain-containing protein [Chitinophaga qingshengii]
MKQIRYYMLLLLTVLAFGSCKKDKTFQHDAAAPIVIDKFTPATGSAGTEVLIYGSNFSLDTSRVSVTVNGVKAYVEGVVEDRILIVVPRKAGSGKIKVTIDGKESASKDDFDYKTSYVVTTLAGNGSAGYADGKGLAASFNFGNRCGLDIDADGNLYVAEAENRRIRKITPDGTVTTLAGSGRNEYAEGKGTAASFMAPIDMAVDKDGTIYTSDPGAWTIRKVAADGTTSHIGWFEAWGIGIDKRNGTLYYTDAGANGSVFRVNPDGSADKIITGLSFPNDVAVDSKGNLFVVVNGSSIIQEYKYGTWEKGITIGQSGATGLVNGPANAARFENPWCIATDAKDNLYVAGNGTWDGSSTNTNQCIRFIAAGTWDVSTYIGGSSAGFADGAGSAALFNAPTGVTVGNDGTVYILDRKNNRIRKVIAE